MAAIRIIRFRSNLAKMGTTSIAGCLFNLNIEEELSWEVRCRENIRHYGLSEGLFCREIIVIVVVEGDG